MSKRTTTTSSRPAMTGATAAGAEQRSTKVPARRKVGAATSAASVSSELRHRMIAEAAYFIAERRGFAAGDETADWLQAETEIDQRLG